MRIRAYTLDVHAGHAPCWMYDESQNCELLTLANCKPLIRDVAPVGEWIAGVTPTPMLRLAYLMQVNERITRTDYWERYKASRFDSIYKPKAGVGWIQLNNPWHANEESGRDLSSCWVLLSKKFYMFANTYSEHGTTPTGLQLPYEFSDLCRGGMRSYGHFVNVPDEFLQWVEQQPRLKLSEFRVLRQFGADGCGCCKHEAADSSKCN